MIIKLFQILLFGWVVTVVKLVCTFDEVTYVEGFIVLSGDDCIVGEVTYGEETGVVGEVIYGDEYIEDSCAVEEVAYVEAEERPLVPLGWFDVMLLLTCDVQVESIVDCDVSHWICIRFIRRKTRRIWTAIVIIRCKLIHLERRGRRKAETYFLLLCHCKIFIIEINRWAFIVAFSFSSSFFL